jgi:DNA-binding response OmpR family regulator
VNRLRRKLSAALPAAAGASLEGLIDTEPGIGYRIADHESLPLR